MINRALYRLPMAWLVVALLSLPRLAYADISADTMPSLCLDGMETVPIDDDLIPTPIAVDGGCMVQQTPVSI